MGTDLTPLPEPGWELAVSAGIPAHYATSIPASVANALRFRPWSPQYASEPSFGAGVSIELDGDLLPIEDLHAARVVAIAGIKPGLMSSCLQATVRLKAVAVRRPTVESDEKLAMVVYAEKLGRYPADAVAQACEMWIERSPFWPSVSEILKACEHVMRPRRELMMVVDRALQERLDRA
jgi:hypothetical protein